ncbi:MAG TPA: hypothetical protein VFQ65_14105, partial [Kofleriaceae bacterium]|nr:hypothetical protein [Kofleriaceae bacterium]
MLRFGIRFAVIAALAGAACSSPAKPVKHAHKTAKPVEKTALEQAHEAESQGETDNADAKYLEAYNQTKSFDALSERVQFLIRAGRATKATEAAKAYYDANVSDTRGIGLYADALLAAGNGSEALERAKEMTDVNSNDPAAHEKKGRALMLLDKSDDGLDELRKAVHLDPKSPTYHLSLGN